MQAYKPDVRGGDGQWKAADEKPSGAAGIKVGHGDVLLLMLIHTSDGRTKLSNDGKVNG